MATATTQFTDLVAEAQKQTVASLKQAQDLSLRATELVVGLVPTQPWDGFGAAPKPTEVVEATFGFAGKVLDAQKAYALQLTKLAADAAQASNGAAKAAKS